MKSLMMFLRSVLEDLGTRCGTSTARDYQTIAGRVEREGWSFLAITLANFGKDLQKGLDLGYVDLDLFQGFTRRGGLPILFGGFLDLVFDRKSGRLLEDPSIDAIYSLRQITLMWAKVNVATSERRTRDAYKAYLECEQQVRAADQDFLPGSNLRRDFSRLGRLLWADLFSQLENDIYAGELIPRHGPGATADKLLGNQKWLQSEWTVRLQSVLPDWEALIPNPHFVDRLEGVDLLEPGAERPSKVTAVPKDARAPRLIAIEPAVMQYVQQAILANLTVKVRANNNARNLICSDSQRFNQLLAKEGSLTGSLATLDLSEASDRVSSQHVRVLVEKHPHLLEVLDASRTRKADVPGHGVIRLAKFASMGSAVCFPFEALVFCTVVFMGIEKSLNRHLTKADISRYFGSVRVYGDDIIVPKDHVYSVVELLEAFGFRVNRNKSFWNGKFRESCGKDYYDGVDVSVVRVRRFLPNDRTDVESVVSTVSLRNQLFHAGFVQAVEHLDRVLERIIPFPAVPWRKVKIDSPNQLPSPNGEENAVWPTRDGHLVIQGSPVLGKHDYQPCQVGRYAPDTHTPQIWGAVVSARPPHNECDDYAALLKWFVMRGEHPFEDKDHLLRSGRPVSVRIKNRWAPMA